MKKNNAKIKDMNETISEISRLVEKLYYKADGKRLIVKSLDRISTSVEILRMNVNDDIPDSFDIDF